MPPGGKVTFCYFEPNEGKNISDVIGSMCKNSWKRGIFDNTDGILNVEDLAERIRKGLKETTKAFEHGVIETFPQILRKPKEELLYEQLNGIMKCHSIYIDSSNTLTGK